MHTCARGGVDVVQAPPEPEMLHPPLENCPDFSTPPPDFWHFFGQLFFQIKKKTYKCSLFEGKNVIEAEFICLTTLLTPFPIKNTPFFPKILKL